MPPPIEVEVWPGPMRLFVTQRRTKTFLTGLDKDHVLTGTDQLYRYRWNVGSKCRRRWRRWGKRNSLVRMIIAEGDADAVCILVSDTLSASHVTQVHFFCRTLTSTLPSRQSFQLLYSWSFQCKLNPQRQDSVRQRTFRSTPPCRCLLKEVGLGISWSQRMWHLSWPKS